MNLSKVKISIVALVLTGIVSGCSSPSNTKTEEQSTAQANGLTETIKISLTPAWATDTVLLTPESAIYDKERKTIYVSNIDGSPWEMDGQGSISKLSPDGDIIDLEWVDGLNCPKGMGIIENSLFVTDNNAVVRIDLLTGAIESRVVCGDEDAKLNDITIGKNGAIYVSDSESSKVYILEDGVLNVFSEDDYERPNGLLVEDDRLLILSFNGAALSQIDLDSKAREKLATGIGQADGIIKISDELGYITSSWSGKVFHISPDYEVTELLDTEADKIGAADIEYIAEEKLLLVPTFFDNRLMAYRVQID